MEYNKLKTLTSLQDLVLLDIDPDDLNSVESAISNSYSSVLRRFVKGNPELKFNLTEDKKFVIYLYYILYYMDDIISENFKFEIVKDEYERYNQFINKYDFLLQDSIKNNTVRSSFIKTFKEDNLNRWNELNNVVTVG